jgi:GT2 family glycosyltransferase
MILTVIIVNYNGAKFIDDCLQSVISQYSFGHRFKVLIWDNASTDNSIERIEPYVSEHVKLIQHPTNVGFPQAHNLLMDEFTTPFLWLLNNDTVFSHTDDIMGPILDHFSTNEAIVGISPQLLNTDGSIQVQGSGFNALKFKRRTVQTVSFLSGASLFIRTSFFKNMGGFDRNLFFYNDDVDFAIHAKRQKKKLIYYPFVSVTHHGGLSTKFQTIETKVGGYIGSLYLCKKYYPRAILVAYKMIIRTLIRLLIIRCAIVSRSNQAHWIPTLKKALVTIKNDV